MRSDQKQPINYTYLRQPLKRYTFMVNGIKSWVESYCRGQRVLNLFAGPTRLEDCVEVTNDLNMDISTTYHMDALECIKLLADKCETFDVVLLDPPYSYRKSMEMYNGNQNSRFKQILDIVPKILKDTGKVITFGYHSRVMSGRRGFRIYDLCIISHGGAQHDTLASVEVRLNKRLSLCENHIKEGT